MAGGILLTKDYQQFRIEPDGIDFTGATKAGRCLPGDLVYWNFTEECCELITRGDHGKLVGVLELTSKTRYGLTARGHSIYLFRPYDSSYPPFIVGSSRRDLTRNMLCSIVFKDPWEEGASFPRGDVVEYFGSVGDWKAERAAILGRWCHGTAAKINRGEWEKEKNRPKPDMINGREELSWGDSFHIDPEGCRDVDDMLTIGHVGDDGCFKVAITIADVGAWVDPTSDIAHCAANIGQTYYSECGVVLRPMLPTMLSEGVCSLKGGVGDTGDWKLGISLILKIHKECEDVLESELKLTKIRSNSIKTYTYDTFSTEESCISGTLYKSLEKAMGRTGDSFGDTHAFVETTMLYYNWWVGDFLNRAGVGERVLYRVQDATDEQRVAAWRAAGEAHGCGMDLGFLGAAAAGYVLGAGGKHAGLGLTNYCHASSPIRRFADLWTQWLIHDILEGREEGAIGTTAAKCVIPIDELVPKVNGLAAANKKFGRDLALVAALERGQRQFQGICLEWRCGISTNNISGAVETWKGKFWVAALKQTVNVRQTAEKKRCDVGTAVGLRLGVNWAAGKWRERVVIEITCDDRS